MATLTAIKLIGDGADNPVTRTCLLEFCKILSSTGRKLKIIVSAGISLSASWASLDNLLTAGDLKNAGVNVLSVCKGGDAVCSPIGAYNSFRVTPIGPTLYYPSGWFNGDTHSNAYINPSISASLLTRMSS